jgi:hypothetical protein
LQSIQKVLASVLDDPWLDCLNFSQAFVACLGAGPWHLNRRRAIQTKALVVLLNTGKDLCALETNPHVLEIYPLSWQNKYLSQAINIGKKYLGGFNVYCDILIHKFQPDDVRKVFYNEFGIQQDKHVKCISLFVRDKLKCPAFPMDRHVERILKQLQIQRNEDRVIKICKDFNINPNKWSSWLFRDKSENPSFEELMQAYKNFVVANRKYFLPETKQYFKWS